MRKDAFADIFPRLAVKRYAFDVELLAVANLYHLKVVEMPVNIKLDAKFKQQKCGTCFLIYWALLIDLEYFIGINVSFLRKMAFKIWFHSFFGNKIGFQTMTLFSKVSGDFYLALRGMGS